MNEMEKVALGNVAKETGFNLLRTRSDLHKEMRKYMSDEEFDDFWLEDNAGFVPDSWVFVDKNESNSRKIIAIEIEDNSKLTISKLRKLADFWWNCEANYVDFELRIYDKFGVNFNEFDLRGFSFAEAIPDLIPETDEFFPPKVRLNCFSKGYWTQKVKEITGCGDESISALVNRGALAVWVGVK